MEKHNDEAFIEALRKAIMPHDRFVPPQMTGREMDERVLAWIDRDNTQLLLERVQQERYAQVLREKNVCPPIAFLRRYRDYVELTRHLGLVLTGSIKDLYVKKKRRELCSFFLSSAQPLSLRSRRCVFFFSFLVLSSSMFRIKSLVRRMTPLFVFLVCLLGFM